MSSIAELPGQRALSAFRLDRLTQALQEADDRVLGLAARYAYFARFHVPVAADVYTRLDALLRAAEPILDIAEDAQRIYVVPRFGTISPWSSKATDIAHACGLTQIERLERGVCYAVKTRSTLSDADLQALGRQLFDRMTEQLLLDSRHAEGLFASSAPRALQTVPLTEEGEKALVEANTRLGLALSDDEIEYLTANYRRMNSDPTDVELMMFAQANSEHCRHKIFGASWEIDGAPRQEQLFGMIKSTTAQSGEGVLSAYSDNAAVIAGYSAPRLFAETSTREYVYHEEPAHILMKVETHNHPTAISPFAGAATGAGGEIRDEGATGLGAKPKAGMAGFSVSHLRLPDLPQPWEPPVWRVERMATPLEIMTEGPIGAAAFNNEFGRPNLAGYFRSLECADPMLSDDERRGYHKPIMIAGGLGNVRASHAVKRDVASGLNVVVIGGPAMLIGLGGGAASSLSSGSSTEDLRLRLRAARQPGNAAKGARGHRPVRRDGRG